MIVQEIELNDANFDAETNCGVSVVCFEEPCDIECRKMLRNVAEAAGEIDTHITVGCCNVETCTLTAERLQITQIPIVLIFKKGLEVERLAGFWHEKTLVKHLRKHLENTP